MTTDVCPNKSRIYIRFTPDSNKCIALLWRNEWFVIRFFKEFGLLFMGYYDIKYHLVRITKYRKPVITGQIAIRTRELVRMICQSNEVEILAGHVGSDHIHLLVSVPPHLSASKLVQYIKGATSRKLQMEYKELNKQFWGQHLWAGGYFVASNG